MGRLRKSNASGYVPNAYVQQYVKVGSLNGGSVEAEKARNLSEDDANLENLGKTV